LASTTLTGGIVAPPDEALELELEPEAVDELEVLELVEALEDEFEVEAELVLDAPLPELDELLELEELLELLLEELLELDELLLEPDEEFEPEELPLPLPEEPLLDEPALDGGAWNPLPPEKLLCATGAPLFKTTCCATKLLIVIRLVFRTIPEPGGLPMIRPLLAGLNLV